MGQFNDTAKTTVIVDGKQAVNQLGKLEMEANEYANAVKKAKRNTDEWLRNNEKLTQTKAKIKALRDEMGLAGMTMRQLRNYQRDLQREMDAGVTRGTQRYKELKAQIQQVNAHITRQRNEVRGLSTWWSKIGAEMKAFGVLALSYLGFTYITGQVSNLIKRMADLSDANAAVQKTTGLTRQQVDDLNQSFKNLNTRTARSELLEMAKIAGKLGITAKRDVEGFVRAANQINVALGEDLGAPEENLKKLGKLVETFKVKDVYGIEDSLLKVGSAINHLGKSSTANEGNIVEFTRRMGGIAPLARITIQDIMGLAAASDALGLTNEITTTSLSKLFLKMTNERENFVKFAKNIDGSQMSLEDFTELIEKDFNQAFFSLLRGVKDNSEGMTALSETLSDLELDGGRVIGVLGTLANNQELITEQQRISNVEFEKGTSILNEYNLMNETLGAKLDKIRKKIFEAFVNSAAVNGLEKLVNWAVKFTEVPLSEQLIREQSELNSLARAIENTTGNQRVRNDLIQQLQDKYPDFLKNLDAETLTNEQLRDRLQEVNEQYYQKIVVAALNEEITESMKEQVDLARKQLELEKEIAALDAKGTSTYQPGKISSSAFAEAKRAERIELQKEYEEINDLIAEKEAEKAALIARFGGNPLATPLGSPTPTAAPPGEQPHWSDPRKGLLDIETEFKNQMDVLEIGYTEQTLTFEEFEKRKEEIARKYAALREQIADEELQKQLENANALFNELGGIFSSISQLQDANTQEGIERQRQWSNASVLASQSAALAGAIAGAVKAAEATGPLAIFTIAPYIAAMVGTVLGAFAGIKSNNAQAQSASTNLLNSKSSSASPRGFYHGDLESGYQSIGMGDHNGRFTGYKHAGEGIIPAYIRQRPEVMNAEAIIAAQHAGFSLARSTTGGTMNHQVSLDGQSFQDAVNSFAAFVTVLQKNGVPAYFPKKAWKDATEYFDEKEKNRNRGKIA